MLRKVPAIVGFLFLSVVAAATSTNASGWTTMGDGNEKMAVWGTSSNDVFAVGDSGTILRYNGSAWSAMTSGTTECLNGI